MKLIKEGDFVIDSETGEIYFDLNNLPKSIYLNKAVLITDCKKFIESHLAFIKTYEKTGIKVPYLDRLIQLKNLL